MKRWKICCGSLVLIAGLAPAARAQLAAPVAGPAVVGAPLPGAVVPVAAPAPAPANLWTFLCPPPDKMAACKVKLCNCALGQMLNNGLRPASAMTGGLVPSLCPLVDPAALAQPADSPGGAAARIEQDAKDAKKRREEVRFLGLQDCHYWPEAQLALINALRADRNECVRLEAAWALGNGCCCGKAVIKALTICVAGSEEDGNPSENSPRVRASAEAALSHCLACYTEIVPVPPDGKKIEGPGGIERPPLPPGGSAKTPDKLPGISKAPVQPGDYYKQVEARSKQEVVEEARTVADRGVTTQVQVLSAAPSANPHSLSDIVRNAFNTAPVVSSAPEAPVVMEQNTQPIPVVPVSSPAPPLAQPLPTGPGSQKPAPAVPPTGPTSWKPAPAAPPSSAVIQTSAVVPATETIHKVQPYQVATFIPNAQPEKAPVVPMVVPVRTAVQTPQNLAVASAKPGLQQSGTTPTQIIALLQNSPGAQQRIWAAVTLSTCDGWTNPDVMDALVKAAKSDTDATVRATCVRCLGRMNVCTLPVLTAVQEMKKDHDPQVRVEVDAALRQLGEVGPMQMH